MRSGAPGTVKILVFGTEQTSLKLRRGAAAMTNMEPALQRVAVDMTRVIRATITGQGRRFGGSWTFLSKNTIEQKLRKGQDPRILVATGKLLEAYGTVGAPHQILEITGGMVQLESDLDYSEFHQDGTVNMPARQFIDFYPQDVRRWADICSMYLKEAMAL
jgi:phage gpG-like protein